MKTKGSGGRPKSSVSIISQRLREILEDQKMTITDLANKTHHDRSGISKSINKGWMDKDLLDDIGRELNVAPCFIKGTEKKSEEVYDLSFRELMLSFLETKKETPLYWAEIHAFLKTHYIGKTDDPDDVVPVKYKYKLFPYSFEKVNNLDSGKLLEELCLSLGLPVQGFTESMYVELLLNTEEFLLKEVIEIREWEINESWRKLFNEEGKLK